MGQHDWYRNTVWTEETKQAFFSRLSRSRSASNKAQYLCCQASYLQRTGKKENIIEAMKLLDMMFTNYPEQFEIASAHLQRAQCFELLGDYGSAVNSYRESIRAEQAYPIMQVGAGLRFAWFVTRCGLTQYYEEAISSVELRESNFLFPNHQFMFFAVFAIIGEHLGKIEDAQRWAIKALEAMNKTESPFQYHKKVGLVKNPDKDIVKKLIRISHYSI